MLVLMPPSKLDGWVSCAGAPAQVPLTRVLRFLHMRFAIVVFFAFLAVGCETGDPSRSLEACDGIAWEEQILYDEDGGLQMQHDLVFEHPECANAVIRFHNITNVHVSTAEDFQRTIEEYERLHAVAKTRPSPDFCRYRLK